MPVYRITDPQTGRKLKITGDSMPTEAELNEVFATINAPDTPATDPTPTVPAPSASDFKATPEPADDSSPGTRTPGQIFNDNINTTVAASKAIGGAIKGAGVAVGQFAKGAVTDPSQTGRGLARGFIRATGEVLDKPVLGVTRAAAALSRVTGGSAASDEQILASHAADMERARSTAGLNAQGQAAMGVGNFASKLGAGLALGAPINTGTLLGSIGQGAVAGAPFAAVDVQQGRPGQALGDLAIGAGIDALTYGAGKYALPAVKRTLGDLRNAPEAAMANRGGIMASPSSAAPPKVPASPQVAAIETIPDIDELAKVVDEVPAQAKIKTTKEIKAAVGDGPKKGLGSRLDDADANMLSEPLFEKDVPFTEYAEQARKAKVNTREKSSMDMVGNRGVVALEEVSKKRNAFGKAKDDILAANEESILDVTDVKESWRRLLSERLGLAIDADGNVITELGRNARRPSEMGTVRRLNKLIQGMDADMFVREADDLKSAINDIVQAPKASQVKQVNTVVEGIGKDIASALDSKLASTLGEGYTTANQNYARLKKIEGRLNKGLGEIIDPETGIPRMGASLMKSAILSNSDRGTKALFKAVFEITGIDLVKEAKYAEMAMRAVGDSRVNDLLKDMGILKSAASGSPDGLFKAVGASVDKFRGDKLDEMIKFYNEAQDRVNKVKTRAAKAAPTPPAPKPPKTLGTLSPADAPTAPKPTLGEKLMDNTGSISLQGKANPQTKTENFKKWFGDWEADKAGASKVVDKDGAPLVVYHGGTGNKENFSRGANRGIGSTAFFTESPLQASSYSLDGIPTQEKTLAKLVAYANETDGGTVTPVYLDIKKPLTEETINLKNVFSSDKNKAATVFDEVFNHEDFSFHDIVDNDDFWDVLTDEMAKIDWLQRGMEKESYALSQSPKVLGMLTITNGHPDLAKRVDALYDGKIYWDAETSAYTYTVNSPNQIKSAMGNSGAFSPSTPDIRGSADITMPALTAGATLGALTAGNAIKAKADKSKKTKTLGSLGKGDK